MTNAITVDFDCTTESVTQVMDDMAARHLDPKVVQWQGPGGGNPQLSITGQPARLARALIEVMGMSWDDAVLHVDGE